MAFYDYWLDAVQDWWERFTTPRPKKASSAFTGEAMRVYVGNLSYAAKDEELSKLFSKYGKVLSIDVIRDRFSKKPKGYAFVEMPPSDGQKALGLNGSEFLGRKIVVSQAKSKERPARQERGEQQQQRGGRGRNKGGDGRREKQGGQQQRQQGGNGQEARGPESATPGEAPRRGKGPRVWKGRNRDLNLPKVQRYDD